MNIAIEKYTNKGVHADKVFGKFTNELIGEKAYFRCPVCNETVFHVPAFNRLGSQVGSYFRHHSNSICRSLLENK